jgi:hypothetical protein
MLGPWVLGSEDDWDGIGVPDDQVVRAGPDYVAMAFEELVR